MIFNRNQGAIKDSLNWITKEVKEVNWDGREIKDSQIQISEENIEMYNSKSRVYLNNFFNNIPVIPFKFRKHSSLWNTLEKDMNNWNILH